MGIFKGNLTLRRYHVEGEVPEDFRIKYQEALQEHAFRDPASVLHQEEVVGWCMVQNLLDTDFSDRDHWLYNHYLVAGLRVDKKVLPSKLFRAHFDKRIQAWCQEHARAKAPASVRQEIKDLLEQEMLAKTLPRVSVTEFCWNVVDGWAILHSTSESANDRFRTLFRNTFGLTTTPFSPLDFLADRPEVSDRLEILGISDYRPDGLGEAP